MKKIITTLLAVILLSGTMFACNNVPDEYKGKTVLEFSVYNGGYGVAYAEKLAADFNASRTDGYAIRIIPEKRNGQDIAFELNTGYSTKSGYILSGLDIMSAVYQDSLEDLSDVALRTVDGTGKTIGDKILRKDIWESMFKVNGKLYALPYGDSLAGLNYDHDLFIEKNWYNFATAADGEKLTAQGITYHAQGNRLVFDSSTGSTNYESGDFILAAGKDGKFGTYDDGQPVNEKEWADMLKKILTSASPFIWSDKDDYTALLFGAVVASYVGEETYRQLFTFDSNGKEVEMQDGSKVVLDIKNGYKAYGAKGIYQALQFFNTYFNTAAATNYTHSACEDNSKSYTDIQNLFLLGYTNDKLNKLSAMIVEGTWWENEARTMFDNLEAINPDRGFGKREYRMMLLPDLEGQKSDKTIMLTGDTGCLFLKKESDPKKAEVAKDFLAYILTDDSLRYFTKTTGNNLAYDYTMTEEEKSALTPYSRNVYELYHDDENIEIIRPLVIENLSPLCFATDKKGFYYSMMPKIDKVFVLSQTRALRQYGFETTWNGIKNAYGEKDWQDFIAKAKEQGFYADL